ncbi:MAG: hypothetical protein IPP72_16920 [Chitinophagaceae bacterium]|nr:hypothetical protein [Chitinophagaceae bacterium]
MPGAKKKIKPLFLSEQYRFVLTAGPWEKWFSEEKYKAIIAMALNDCLQNKEKGMAEICINGYLIKGRRVYVVWEIPAGYLYKLLDFFYWRVRETIRGELRVPGKWYDRGDAGEKPEILKAIESPLFERSLLGNEWLLQLITGNQIELEYYSPKLERLKNIIHGEAYCSVIDYAGGQGPVNIAAVKKEKHHAKQMPNKKQ